VGYLVYRVRVSKRQGASCDAVPSAILARSAFSVRNCAVTWRRHAERRPTFILSGAQRSRRMLAVVEARRSRCAWAAPFDYASLQDSEAPLRVLRGKSRA
jgi:hypothetical protein